MTDDLPVPAPPLWRPLDRLYALTLALADWLNCHRVAVAVVAAPVVTLGIVAINRFVLLDFPNSGDEYTYLYQAQTLAAGRLWNPAPSPPDLFAFNYIVQEPGRAFGSFPFGWPLMLALAMRLGLPPWLVNPLMGTVTLGLIWCLGVRLYTPRVGVLAAAIVGVSPFFLFNAASYFSHTFCGALLLGAACLAARANRTPAWVPVLTGLLIGGAVVTRYFTGVVCAVPIALWLVRPGVRRTRT
ncbi:MAG: glycosyltransferase family 39 protein, partial [Acidobacteriota bacterium]|nr:glycosyltransferase family 39 protein [Acidobacteriota bacterium]